MTRVERKHQAASRYAREAVNVRDPFAIAATGAELDHANRRLAAQRERCRSPRRPHHYETCDLAACETLGAWRARTTA